MTCLHQGGPYVPVFVIEQIRNSTSINVALDVNNDIAKDKAGNDLHERRKVLDF